MFNEKKRPRMTPWGALNAVINFMNPLHSHPYHHSHSKPKPHSTYQPSLLLTPSMDPVEGIYKQQIRSKSFCITPGQLSEADLSLEAK